MFVNRKDLFNVIVVRGDCTKAHLTWHLKNAHNIIHKPSKVSTVLYIITKSDVTPTTKKTLARTLYYQKYPILKSRDIYHKKHYYLPNVLLKNHHIHYDLKQGFIKMTKINLVNSVKIKKNNKSVKIQSVKKN